MYLRSARPSADTGNDAASTARFSWHRHARTFGAGLCECARGAGRQRRRGHDRAKRRVHADTCGLARDPGYNRGRTAGIADGIVVTPSHNPPDNGGFKYNPPNGGPADKKVTAWIEKAANALLRKLKGVQRVPIDEALHAATTHRYDFLRAYVGDLGHVIDMDVVRGASIRIGVDPLGGAGVHYWAPIAERYGLNLDVVNEAVDPTFRFMTVDWDGRIRMDPSSPYAMQALIGMKDRFDIAFALRHRSRPSRHRDRKRRTPPAEPLSCGGDRLSVSASPAVARSKRRWARPSSAAS